jgi:beta-ribofuranosylaminobenzene 5'-phosphate synthase
MMEAVHVRAPCRLHFGMLSFGHIDRAQFGGVGMMIQPPAVKVTIAPAERFMATGTLADRVERFVRLAAEHWRLDHLPPCTIEARSPRDHIGLGVGTQLALATAAGLRRFFHLPDLPAEALAACVARGQRSAVGTHGFLGGGLVVDAGKTPGQSLGTLADRRTVPDSWRIVLICPHEQHGRAGDGEARAFASLPPVPAETSRELERLIDDQMLPAVERADCAAFGEAVYRYGRLAGLCFAAVQGGPFASPAVAALVETIRGQGVPGVGQSSWGPTVFAFTPDQQAAERLADHLRDQHGVAARDLAIARSDNRGATVESVPRIG